MFRGTACDIMPGGRIAKVPAYGETRNRQLTGVGYSARADLIKDKSSIAIAVQAVADTRGEP